MKSEFCQNEVDVLVAIDDVRQELMAASKRNAELTEMREIHERLISLYAALNIKNVLSIIDHKEAA